MLYSGYKNIFQKEKIMKKIGKITLSVIAAAIMAFAAIGLAACGETPAQITETYIGRHTVTVQEIIDQEGNTVPKEYTYFEQLQLFDDGTYAMTQIQPVGMATYIVYATGKYAKKEKNDKFEGYTEIALERATYVQVNQDIYNHMFGLTIDTEKSQFPHEIAGGAMKTKEDILNEYGDFGSRFIMHRATVDDTHAENWMDVEADVEVVE